MERGGANAWIQTAKEGGSNDEGLRVWETFQKSFVEVDTILDQNRNLIKQINQNHEDHETDSIATNVGLIRELNSNIGQVVELYANLSSQFVKSELVSAAIKHEVEAGERLRKPTSKETNGFSNPPSIGNKKLRQD